MLFVNWAYKIYNVKVIFLYECIRKRFKEKSKYEGKRKIGQQKCLYN